MQRPLCLVAPGLTNNSHLADITVSSHLRAPHRTGAAPSQGENPIDPRDMGEGKLQGINTGWKMQSQLATDQAWPGQ